MNFETTIAGNDVGVWPVGQLGLEDTADTTLHDHLQIYGAELECTDWSIEEKIAFLDDEANRAFLREFSAANGRKQIQKVMATVEGGVSVRSVGQLELSLEEEMAFLNDRANQDFLRQISSTNRDRIQTALAEELAFD